jgi:hypothetical protein
MKTIAVYTYDNEHVMFVLAKILREVFEWREGRILDTYAYCLN